MESGGEAGEQVVVGQGVVSLCIRSGWVRERVRNTERGEKNGVVAHAPPLRHIYPYAFAFLVARGQADAFI